jgi:hypothetical protein
MHVALQIDKSQSRTQVRFVYYWCPLGLFACDHVGLCAEQPINLPQAPLFSPTVTVIVRDTKLGGLVHSTIGMASIPLLDKVRCRHCCCSAALVVPERGHRVACTHALSHIMGVCPILCVSFCSDSLVS